jgi:hypothetical protein
MLITLHSSKISSSDPLGASYNIKGTCGIDVGTTYNEECQSFQCHNIVFAPQPHLPRRASAAYISVPERLVSHYLRFLHVFYRTLNMRRWISEGHRVGAAFASPVIPIKYARKALAYIQ